MTVAELIAKLQAMPQDAPVAMLEHDRRTYYPIEAVEQKQLVAGDGSWFEPHAARSTPIVACIAIEARYS